MDSGKELDQELIEELKKTFEGEEIVTLPVTIKVEQDDLPDIERWKSHE